MTRKDISPAVIPEASYTISLEDRFSPQYNRIEEVLFTHHQGFGLALCSLALPVVAVMLLMLAGLLHQPVSFFIFQSSTFVLGVICGAASLRAMILHNACPAKTPVSIGAIYFLALMLFAALPDGIVVNALTFYTGVSFMS